MTRRWIHVGVWLGVVAVCASAPTLARAGTWAHRGEDVWYGATRFETNGFTVPVDNFPVKVVFLGDPPPGLSVDAIEQAARTAAAAWSDVPCSSAKMVYAGKRASLDELGPGEVPFLFADPQNTACFPEGTIGWTALTCGDAYPNKTVFLNDSTYDWSVDPKPFQPAKTDRLNPDSHRLIADVQSVLTHEFGHVLGLAHSKDVLATMAPTYRADGGQRTLAVDDKLGLCSLYPVPDPPDECSRDRDCPPQESCAQVQEMHLCRELRGQLGDDCGFDRLICTDTCVLPDNPHHVGYCTTACDPQADQCPDGYVCTEGLVGPGESHCRRLRPPPDDSTCTVATGWRRRPMSLWAVFIAVLMLAALVARRWRLTGRSASR